MEWISVVLITLVVLIVGVAFFLTTRTRRNRALDADREFAPPAQADARVAASRISRDADAGGSSGGL